MVCYIVAIIKRSFVLLTMQFMKPWLLDYSTSLSCGYDQLDIFPKISQSTIWIFCITIIYNFALLNISNIHLGDIDIISFSLLLLSFTTSFSFLADKITVRAACSKLNKVDEPTFLVNWYQRTNTGDFWTIYWHKKSYFLAALFRDFISISHN